MKTLIAASFVVVAATAFVAAQQTMQLPPRPAPMGAPGARDTGPQPMPKGTAVMSGTITSIDGGRPMRRASVRISAVGSPMSRNTTTDDHGNFTFKELPAGDFTLRASKPGYLETIYGQKRPGSGRAGTPLSLKDGQQLDKLALSIAKGGVLTGQILDDVGEPQYGVNVRALRWAYRGGERQLISAGSGTTDDRGVYRISTLLPGDYVVMATPRSDSIGAPDEVRQALEEMAATAGAAGVSFGGASGLTSIGGSMSTTDAPTSGFAPVFFPSTTLASSASTITLAAAEEKAAIDVQLQLVPLGTITGTVIGDPRAVQATSIQLSDSNTGLPGLTARSARPDAQGRFSFTGVAPGQYNLNAKSGGGMTVMSDGGGGNVTMFMTREVTGGSIGGRGGEPPAPPMWAKAEIAVDGRNKTDVALVLQNGMNISGRVAFDGNPPAPIDLTTLRIILASSSANGLVQGSSTAQVDAEGRFKIANVIPGRYRFTAPPPRGWRAKSVTEADGRDALDFQFEVKPGEDQNDIVLTYTNKPAEVGGVLQDSSGQPTSAYTIILFATDQRYWTPSSRRILSTRPSTDGKYSFRDLPAGDYRLVALDDAEPDSWFDPNFLKTLFGSAMSVTIVEGEKKTQDIKVNR